MSAPAGNQFWKSRSTHGRKPIFKNPDELWDACEQYFQWVVDNPLKEEKAFAYQGEITTHDLTKMRAMTMGGLWIFLDISKDTWWNYRDKEDFLSVTTRVEEVVREQKFTGAAADLLNANIIARDLGLADRKEHTGPGGGAIRTISNQMSAREAAELYADTLQENTET